jgi:hypothetical protein
MPKKVEKTFLKTMLWWVTNYKKLPLSEGFLGKNQKFSTKRGSKWFFFLLSTETNMYLQIWTEIIVKKIFLVTQNDQTVYLTAQNKNLWMQITSFRCILSLR